MIPTAEQIVEAAEQAATTQLGVIRLINKAYRDMDESRLWPICGRFNATNRAIRRVNNYERNAGTVSPLERAYMIEGELSQIVNAE